ncbi:MAG TPA: nuclear transport factor 2 family protein [Herpetosiphonaceae bacterium]
MVAQITLSTQAVIENLHTAMNQHDLKAFLDCFAPDYRSAQPCHPDRSFHGRERLSELWSSAFERIPDFHADLLRLTVDGETAWTEWHWQGTRRNGPHFNLRGVILFEVQLGQIVYERVYLEGVQQPPPAD